jgi:hypothetical protein
VQKMRLTPSSQRACHLCPAKSPRMIRSGYLSPWRKELLGTPRPNYRPPLLETGVRCCDSPAAALMALQPLIAPSSGAMIVVCARPDSFRTPARMRADENDRNGIEKAAHLVNCARLS